MPKNPNSKSKSVKRDEPMNGAMKFFLAGCIAELYLLIVRRFYINADSDIQRFAWYDSYLKILMGAGAAVLAVGLILSILWRSDRKKRVPAWYVLGGGLFLAVSSGMIRHFNAPAVTLLIVVVPVAMLLGILWSLYDRECALALTILGVSLIALWICRREMDSVFLGTYVKAAAVIYIVVLAALALLVKQGKLQKLLPARADTLPVYVALGLSVAAMAVALVSTTVAYYVMWVLAMVVFGLAVYYTVKQL